jgi:hypothetical protein
MKLNTTKQDSTPIECCEKNILEVITLATEITLHEINLRYRMKVTHHLDFLLHV